MIVTVNRDYFPEQHKTTDLCNGNIVFFEVGSGLLHIIQMSFGLQRVKVDVRNVNK
jgi:hypothetical protein